MGLIHWKKRYVRIQNQENEKSDFSYPMRVENKDTELKSEASYGLFWVYGIRSNFFAGLHQLSYTNHLEKAK